MTQKRWDSYDAYLFDIDGTLLNCTDAVHYFAFCDALSLIAGRPLNLDDVVTHGSVDVAILRDGWAHASVPESVWRPRLGEVRDRMCAQVEQNRDDLRINVLPGAKAVLTHLRERGAKLGVATGNLAGVGRVKLAQCGLWDFFDFGGFSDAFETRADVFRAAAEQARGLTSPSGSICVIGDTPADVQAAHANSLDVIAVATGIFSHEELVKEKPTRCIRSLSELLSDSAT